MRKILFMMLALVSVPVWAAGSGYPLLEPHIDLSDKASLQRGAKYYVNYCMGCHALEHLRYNRMGRDLGLTDRQVLDNLVFTRDEEGSPTKVGSKMTIAMDKLYADKAFGVVPPDLTLTARSRGSDWIYTYLLTFYVDPSKQWGVNNAVFPNVGMPHVMADLQGLQKPVIEKQTDAEGNTHEHIVGFEITEPGLISAEEYEQVALDLTNFLTYAAEPAKLFRYKVGIWAMILLLLLAAATYALKKEYWRDIK